MIIVDNVLISEDVVEQNFVCDVAKCKGACCVEGDTGAPLEEWEIEELETSIEAIKPYLAQDGQKSIAQAGCFEYDSDGEYVTPLVDGRECAFAVFDKNEVASCGIEKAYENGVTDFRKPVSCHLYPVRISKHVHNEAMNYHRWSICDPARELGDKLNVPVYKFVREALVREYGEKWYEELERQAEERKNGCYKK